MEDVLRPTQVPRSKECKQDTIKMLLQAALANPPSSPSDSSPGSSKENHSRQMNGEVDMMEKEAKQLRAIKRLMEIKGYESMMKFLES
jgi:hypothetical protein